MIIRYKKLIKDTVYTMMADILLKMKDATAEETKDYAFAVKELLTGFNRFK